MVSGRACGYEVVKGRAYTSTDISSVELHRSSEGYAGEKRENGDWGDLHGDDVAVEL